MPYFHDCCQFIVCLWPYTHTGACAQFLHISWHSSKFGVNVFARSEVSVSECTVYDDFFNQY